MNLSSMAAFALASEHSDVRHEGQIWALTKTIEHDHTAINVYMLCLDGHEECVRGLLPRPS